MERLVPRHGTSARRVRKLPRRIGTDAAPFLSEVLKRGPQGACLWIDTFEDASKPDWSGSLYRPNGPLYVDGANAYYSIALFPENATARLKQQMLGAAVIVCDDVGQKVSDVDVRHALGEPTFRIQTSPGNEQWGYFFSRLATAGEVDQIHAMLLEHRLSDANGLNAVRYARLPAGINNKPEYAPNAYPVRMLEEAFDRVYDPAALLMSLQANPSDTRGEAQTHDGRIYEGQRNEYLSREAYRFRKQGLTVEQIQPVLGAINETCCSPPLHKDEVRQIARGKARIVGGENVNWQDPKPLEDTLPPVEPFSSELLPEALRPWVVDIAERIQCPIEYVAVSAMVTLGAALGRKIAVRPKRRDDWHEFSNLWGVVIGPPSWMKSPAMDDAKAALQRLEDRKLEEFELAHGKWEITAAAEKTRVEGARRRAIQAAKKHKTFDAKELVPKRMEDEPRQQRLIVNDANVASLCEVLISSPNGVLVFRDELSGLIAELDQEGMEGARGFFISSWSGKEPYTQDRIGRGLNRHLPHYCLSMLGGIQPVRVAPLLRESLATGGGDGFLARFSLAVWPNPPGEYRKMDRTPDTQARKTAQEVYERLHALEPRNVGACFVSGTAPFLRLAPEAAEMFAEWHVALVNRMRSGGEDAALAAHLLKYPKSVAGLAVLLHLADGGKGEVSRDAVARALRWARFLESHARRIYASLGQAHIDAARSLLKHIEAGDLFSPFKLREVYRKGWAHLLDFDTAQAAADVLEAKGYIQACPLEPGQQGGRPTVEYAVNPAVLRKVRRQRSGGKSEAKTGGTPTDKTDKT